MHEKAGPYEAAVLSCRLAASDICALTLQMPPGVVAGARPGQFADICIPDDAGFYQLRRPFSAAWLAPHENTVLFYFRILGPGTKRLAACRPGDSLNVLFPLGNGYTPPAPGTRTWVIGGGTGVASVLCLRSVYDTEMTFFLGFRSRQDVFPEETMYAGAGLSFDEDGATVIDLVREKLKVSAPPERILACGPAAMYRALASVCRNIPTEISLEERMGCGTGGCQACVALIGGQYRRTCTDGPVFLLEEVDRFAG